LSLHFGLLVEARRLLGAEGATGTKSYNEGLYPVPEGPSSLATPENQRPFGTRPRGVIFAGWQSVSKFETYRRRECTAVWRRRQFDQLLSSFTNRIVYDRIRFGLSLFGHLIGHDL